MKISFIILPLLACVSQINAAGIIVDTDFTAASEMPAGWISGQWNGNNPPHYDFSANKGASVKQPWKQNSLSYSLGSDDLISSAGGASYAITFSTYASTKNQQNFFYLSSGEYSIVIGNSYDSNADVAVGSLDEAIGDSFVSFQPGINRVVLSAITGSSASGNMVNVGTSLDYSLTLSSGLLTMTVTDGTNTYLNTYTVGKDFSFDKVGFINDGNPGTAGVKNLKITQQVPEASTASLGLLALAGLMLRRRRI